MTNEVGRAGAGGDMHTNTSTVLETASYVMYLLGRRLAINIRYCLRKCNVVLDRCMTK